MKQKLFAGIALIIMLAMLVTACGKSAYSNEMDYQAVAPSASEMPIVNYSAASTDSQDNGGLGASKATENEAGSAAPKQDVTFERKIIKEGTASLETKEFDKTIDGIDQIVESVGGFAEIRTVKGENNNTGTPRYANFVIRVPAGVFENVMQDLGNVGTVVESNSKGTDITDQYTDSQTRVNTLKVQEQTLIEIMAKATKLEDVITLEQRISEVRYQIESLENTLKNYDRLVALSRITINVSEVTVKTETKPIPETLGQRISSTFNDSLESIKTAFEDFVVWVVGSWLGLIITLLFIVVLTISYKRNKKKRRKAAEENVIQNDDVSKH